MNSEQVIEQKMTDKRLESEIKRLDKSCCKSFQYYQDVGDKHIFYFMFRGSDNSSLRGGQYLVKFILAKNYPKTFGRVYILTPNGKYVHSDGFDHGDNRESLHFAFSDSKNWSPIYTLCTIVESIIQMFHDPEVNGISKIKCSEKEIRQYAADSVKFNAQSFPDIWSKFSH